MGIMNRLIGLTGEAVADTEEEAGLDRPFAWLRRKGGNIIVNRMVGAAIPFAPRNRFSVEAVRSGYVRARIALKGNRNHFGSLYAGAAFLVAEIPGGVLTLFDMGPDYTPILKEMTMEYLAPADSDVTIELTMPASVRDSIQRKADETGRASFTLEGELKDESGQIVARSTAHYRVRKKGFEAVS
ncbi:uncharacterized protein DUF4442 [Tamilnaduibacter salinus]|uniref:DUF4442 domain-containing protein n=1 Tax=Tamilnaduibacter salinus TaxID=1484056 RepID=A0A2A2I4T6_9GAMM|nr:DUF4442 domain-containing protein [Tamilnaduibacter salinus]PAV26408.1 DUF4442 domain-containing protein [Tamilnaduibacter salinus]PVY78153.1 uncharacterized protein DUF4442 [Tamilnaduibacter salinus]